MGGEPVWGSCGREAGHMTREVGVSSAGELLLGARSLWDLVAHQSGWDFQMSR